MPWPPVIPPATRANATPQLDTHASDHNALSQALTDVVAKVNGDAPAALVLLNGWAAATGWTAPRIHRFGPWRMLDGMVAHPAAFVAATHTVMFSLAAADRPLSGGASVHDLVFNLWTNDLTPSIIRSDLKTATGNVTVAFPDRPGGYAFLSLAGVVWSVL